MDHCYKNNNNDKENNKESHNNDTNQSLTTDECGSKGKRVKSALSIDENETFSKSILQKSNNQ